MNDQQLKSLSSRINQLKRDINTEEATKHSLILPFIQALGYDVFNPKEVVPEYVADFGTKQGEKVDYAICQNGEPIIIIEAKACSIVLNDNHASQLFRYFTVSKAKYAILTNGIEYRFYTDTAEINIMDKEPFYKLDMSCIKNTDVTDLNTLSKGSFNTNTLRKVAVSLRYEQTIVDYLMQQMSKPSKQFMFVVMKESGIKAGLGINEAAQLVMGALAKFMQMDNGTGETGDGTNEQAVISEHICLLTDEENKCIEAVKKIMANNKIDCITEGKANKWVTGIKVIIGDKHIKLITLYRNGQQKPIWGFSIAGYAGEDTTGTRNSVAFNSPEDILKYERAILDAVNSNNKEAEQKGQ